MHYSNQYTRPQHSKIIGILPFLRGFDSMFSVHKDFFYEETNTKNSNTSQSSGRLTVRAAGFESGIQ